MPGEELITLYQVATADEVRHRLCGNRVKRHRPGSFGELYEISCPDCGSIWIRPLLLRMTMRQLGQRFTLHDSGKVPGTFVLVWDEVPGNGPISGKRFTRLVPAHEADAYERVKV